MASRCITSVERFKVAKFEFTEDNVRKRLPETWALTSGCFPTLHSVMSGITESFPSTASVSKSSSTGFYGAALAWAEFFPMAKIWSLFQLTKKKTRKNEIFVKKGEKSTLTNPYG